MSIPEPHPGSTPLAKAWSAFLERPGEAEFRPLYEHSKRLIWTLCARILRHREDSDDAFQATYCRLLAIANERSPADRAPFPADSIYRVAVQEADRIRKRRDRAAARRDASFPLELMNDPRQSTEALAVRREARERVEAIVGGLPETYRLPIELCYFHGLSHREIAQALGQPASSVSDRIRSGLRKLDSAFRKAGLGEPRATLAGVVLAGALLEPPLSAAAVYRGAQALLVSQAASGSGASSGGAARAVFSGWIIMKYKTATVLSLILLALAGVLVFREPRRPATPPAADPARAPLAAGGLERGAVSERKGSTSAGVKEAETKTIGARAGEVVIAPPPGDSITGVIADIVSGAPIAGAVVRAGQQEALSNGEGVYTLSGLGTGTHSLIASAEGYADLPANVSHAKRERSTQDFRLDPAASVRILVADEAGNPLSGAKVMPSMYGSDGSFNWNDGVDTDRSGAARLPKISRLQPRQIQVARDGFQSVYVRPSIGFDDLVELRAVLKRVAVYERAIEGRVTDTSSHPIAGALVEWKDGGGTRFGDGEQYGQFKATTDGDGFYRLEYTDTYETCSLGIAARGWAPVVAAGIRPGTREKPLEQNFSLEQGHWLSGRVLDEDAKPLAKVLVRVMPRVGLLNEAIAYPAVLREAETDDDGQFRLEDLPGPRAGIYLRSHDRRPALEDEIDVDREVDLTLPSYGVIRGRVTEAGSGEPVKQFRVRLTGNAISGEQYDPGESFSSQDGRFALKGLHRNGTFDVIVEADGYLPGRMEKLAPSSAGEAVETAIPLERGQLLEGVVIDDVSGVPLAGVQILSTALEQARDFYAMEWDSILRFPGVSGIATGVTGEIQIREGKPSTLMLRAPGRTKLFIAPEDRSRYITQQGTLRIPLAQGQRLTGTLVEGGRPRDGVTLRLERSGAAGVAGSTHGFTRTSPEGKFAWDDLAPGSYRLEHARSVEGMPAGFEVKTLRRVTIEPGVETAVDLGSDAGALAIRGRIRGMEGRESVWATVALVPLDGADVEIRWTTYKEWDWRFACPSLKPGKYAASLEIYSREGNLSLPLPELHLTVEGEHDFKVPSSS